MLLSSIFVNSSEKNQTGITFTDFGNTSSFVSKHQLRFIILSFVPISA